MNFKYVDIHSHLQMSEYDSDREAVLMRMKEAGVATIVVGVDYETSLQAVEMAERNENIYACVGLHPKDNLTEVFDVEAYRKLVQNPKVVAIGECGLDFFRLEGNSGKVEEIKAQQKKLFIQQIELAIETDKPLMLHCRDAYREVLDILIPYKKQVGDKIRGNVHFFAGDVATAREFIELGFTVSFTGVVTFARNYDEVIRSIPLESILSETDAPFVAPAPYRGKRNEPAYVVEVVKKLAEIRSEDPEKVRTQLLENVRRVFGI
ncbi:TatD family deoxyribonuclease [Patescibacteria group bacterium]|nr:MAG: TatD family deoxyribonuclease [Patescibacteria group bacterium]